MCAILLVLTVLLPINVSGHGDESHEEGNIVDVLVIRGIHVVLCCVACSIGGLICPIFDATIQDLGLVLIAVDYHPSFWLVL